MLNEWVRLNLDEAESSPCKRNMRKSRRSGRVRRPERSKLKKLTGEARVNILGINAYHGNASAALVCDGRLDRRGRRRALQSREVRRGISRGGDPLLP